MTQRVNSRVQIVNRIDFKACLPKKANGEQQSCVQTLAAGQSVRMAVLRIGAPRGPKNTHLQPQNAEILYIFGRFSVDFLIFGQLFPASFPNGVDFSRRFVSKFRKFVLSNLNIRCSHEGCAGLVVVVLVVVTMVVVVVAAVISGPRYCT